MQALDIGANRNVIFGFQTANNIIQLIRFDILFDGGSVQSHVFTAYPVMKSL